MSCSRKVGRLLFAFLAIGIVINGANAKPPKRIQEGRLATGSEFSGTVSLARPGNPIHTCGGAIIGPNHILTAAHCVNDRTRDDITVRAGIHDIRDSANVVERLVKKIVVHPNYIIQTAITSVQNDIAILVLKDALPIGGRVQKYLLPTHEPEDGSYTVSGWGRNSPNPDKYQFELKALSMFLGDKDRCGSLPGTICAYSDSGSTCGGDSGSPLIRGGYIYGIDSAGSCTIGLPTTFTNVYHFINWINDVIKHNP